MPVYLVSGVAECHKIGRTQNLAKRMAVLGKLVGNLAVVHTIETERLSWLEMMLHRAFDSVRVEGEWFRLTETDIALIRSISSASCPDDLPIEIVRRAQEFLDSKRVINMSREIADQLRTIADHREISMAEALDKFGGPGIIREYRKVVEEMHTAVFGGES